ncbi:MAG: hypothetical protein II155_05975, partial [Clostridia bacterium]|nr:hypothetical protein [Clostridia bacterium]
DGVVDAKDAEDMRYYLEKYKGQNSNNYYRMGDLNLDGTVDNNDLKGSPARDSLFSRKRRDIDPNSLAFRSFSWYHIYVEICRMGVRLWKRTRWY